MATKFYGISFGAVKDRVCVIAGSDGLAVVKQDGLRTRQAIGALLALVPKDGVPVVYDSAVDFELLLRDLSVWDKDRLFGVWRAAEERVKDTPLYESNRSAETIDLDGLRVSYLSGKICHGDL